MGDNKAKLGELYFRSNSVQFGSFRMSVHQDNPELPLSPYYLHYPKPGEPGSELLPELYEAAGLEFYSICEAQDPPIRPKLIAGVPLGALPLAEAHARHYEDYPNNLLVFTKVEGPNGTLFLPSKGEFTKGEEIVFDDDHTSGARNKKLVRTAAFLIGLRTSNMLTVVNRQQGAVENLQKLGVRLLSIFEVDELFQIGVELGEVTQNQVDEAIEYRSLNQY